MLRDIKRVYIHCSASTWGTFKDVDTWHKQRNFPPFKHSEYLRACYIGYHYLILNSFARSSEVGKGSVSSHTDGQVIEARPVSIVGAQVRGDNTKSIGICYIGMTPTPMQAASLLSLCITLIKRYRLSVDDILGHYEYYQRKGEPEKKTCPNFEMSVFREMLKHRLAA